MKHDTRLWSQRIQVIVSALAVALLGAPADGSEVDRVRPRYDRDEVRRPSNREIPVRDLPEELRLKVEAGDVEARPSEVAPGRSARSRGPVPPGDPATEARHRDADEAAVRAAVWTAAELSRTLGWREYYRVGFHRGMQAALEDESLASWDYMEGLRFGQLDPEARRLGSDAGYRAAEEAAYTAAEAQVAGQFMDLGREPRYDPRPAQPAYGPGARWAVAPQLSEVFLDFPITRVPHMTRRAAEAFEGWDWNPWRLQGCSRYGEFYDDGWSDAARAFSFWTRDRRRASVYLRLETREARARFARIFEAEFVGRLPAYFDRHLSRAHRLGFQDGWRYGAFINFEWHYRLGYNEGFDQAVVSAALTGFRRVYPRVFESHYDGSFRDWSENPKPAIRALYLEDGNDDGIFQPGEEIRVDYELANLGGRAGEFEARLEGGVLDRPAEAVVRLPARDSARAGRAMRARISPQTDARTRASLDFRLADQHESVSLYVSHPLEFLREVDLEGDNLNGRARLMIRVVNRSRKQVRGSVDLAAVEGYAFGATRDLGTLKEGEARSTSFELTDLRPLDMISGRLRLHFSVGDGDQVQDDLEFRFPDAATDLRNRDLLQLMVAFSRNDRVSRAEVAAARALMLRRIETDWTATVGGKGNPYKQDFKQNGSRTALGDLVQTYLRERRGMQAPEVFTGLGREIETLAGDLPGSHPFLRKYMKRLARKLG